MNLLAGSVLDRRPGPKYTRNLRFAELRFQDPLPRVATLGRWRDDLPDDFSIALRAPRQAWNSEAGALRFDSSLESGLAWLIEAADRLRAALIVVETGHELTPGQRSRDRLQAYFERFTRREDQTLVWSPTGLWEPETVQRVAQLNGVLGAIDALDAPVPPGEIVYGTMVARGARRSFSHQDLDTVAHRLAQSGVPNAFVVIDSNRSFQEASLLQTIAAEG